MGFSGGVGVSVTWAERTVAQSRDLLLAERLGDVRVDACFHYGAVEINPRHLVVWILLAGNRGVQAAWAPPRCARKERGHDSRSRSRSRH